MCRGAVLSTSAAVSFLAGFGGEFCLVFELGSGKPSGLLSAFLLNFGGFHSLTEFIPTPAE